MKKYLFICELIFLFPYSTIVNIDVSLKMKWASPVLNCSAAINCPSSTGARNNRAKHFLTVRWTGSNSWTWVVLYRWECTRFRKTLCTVFTGMFKDQVIPRALHVFTPSFVTSCNAEDTSPTDVEATGFLPLSDFTSNDIVSWNCCRNHSLFSYLLLTGTSTALSPVL